MKNAQYRMEQVYTNTDQERATYFQSPSFSVNTVNFQRQKLKLIIKRFINFHIIFVSCEYNIHLPTKIITRRKHLLNLSSKSKNRKHSQFTKLSLSKSIVDRPSSYCKVNHRCYLPSQKVILRERNNMTCRMHRSVQSKILSNRSERTKQKSRLSKYTVSSS